MLTDSEGHFAFENLPKGTIALSTRKPGFCAPGSTENSLLRNIELGPNTNKVELRLLPEAGFSARLQIVMASRWKVLQYRCSLPNWLRAVAR